MRSMVHAFVFVALAAAVAGVCMVGQAAATPSSTDVVFHLRVFNDNPGSTVTTTNGYPGMVAIEDVGGLSGGFANLHNWHMSTGGVEDAFNNGDAFGLCATLVMSGDHNGEAGLQLSPWWSQQVDGRMNVRLPDGEVACFGGRLPFYSFTANHGLVYQRGKAIRLQLIYLPNELNAAHPATIEYKVIYEGGFYSSGALPFDMGNPAEDPPHGLWGCLNDARLGGFVQPFVAPDPFFVTGLRGQFSDICYTNLGAVPDASTSWGKIKNLYRD